MTHPTLVVTGCDAAHYGLASELLESLNDLPERAFDIGFLQVGVTPLPDDIRDRADHIVWVDDAVFRHVPRSGYAVAYLGVKAALPEYFPGYETYVWLDGDTWVQDSAGIDDLVEASGAADVALHPECDINYLSEIRPSERTMSIYRRLFPELAGTDLPKFAMINSGVFAAKAGSPLWARWRASLDSIRERSATEPNLYFSDQIPLHSLIFTRQLSVSAMPAETNWQVYTMPPQLDLARRRLVSPLPPYADIAILHLSGATKGPIYKMAGLDRAISFRYREIKAILAGGEPAQPTPA
jgi:hypothetical protein